VVIFPFELLCIWLCPSTYNTEFVALAVDTINLVKWEFLLCEWSLSWLSALLFRLGW